MREQLLGVAPAADHHPVGPEAAGLDVALDQVTQPLGRVAVLVVSPDGQTSDRRRTPPIRWERRPTLAPGQPHEGWPGSPIWSLLECRLDADVPDEVGGDCHADEPAPNRDRASGRLHRPVDERGWIRRERGASRRCASSRPTSSAAAATSSRFSRSRLKTSVSARFTIPQTLTPRAHESSGWSPVRHSTGCTSSRRTPATSATWCATSSSLISSLACARSFSCRRPHPMTKTPGGPTTTKSARGPLSSRRVSMTSSRRRAARPAHARSPHRPRPVRAVPLGPPEAVCSEGTAARLRLAGERLNVAPTTSSRPGHPVSALAGTHRIGLLQPDGPIGCLFTVHHPPPGNRERLRKSRKLVKSRRVPSTPLGGRRAIVPPCPAWVWSLREPRKPSL